MPTRKKASRGTASGKGRGATRDAAALRASLARWDGRTASTIEAVFEWWRGDSALPRLLAQLLDEGELDVAVTWLIKRGLEQGALLPTQVAAPLFRNLGSLHEPYAQLHVLQVLDRLAIPPASREAVEQFVRAALESPSKFVAAWALSGFHALATQHAAYREEARRLLERAVREGPASARARARILLATGFDR